MWDVCVCVFQRLKWIHDEEMPVKMSVGEELRWIDHLQMIQRPVEEIYWVLSELAGLIKVLAAEVLIMDLIKQECNMI